MGRMIGRGEHVERVEVFDRIVKWRRLEKNMIEVKNFVECLKDSGVDFFIGVPDSLLKSFCAYVTDNCGENHEFVHGV